MSKYPTARIKARIIKRRVHERLFDDRFTAREFGFADASDYYAKASALPLMGDVRKGGR